LNLNQKPIRFVDVFAGCGGLSLGLLQAGFEGVFAVEKSALAFETLRHNLVDGVRYTFNWPEWLEKKAMTCEELLANYASQLEELRGTVDLLVGGPPCQGFSTAGRRDPADPRNQMTEQYLALVQMLRPKYLAIENVAGYNKRFDTKAGFEQLVGDAKHSSYADYVAKRLHQDLQYWPSRNLVNCASFGVPQNRLRYLVLCERMDDPAALYEDLVEKLIHSREDFLRSKGLPINQGVTVKEAIGDLTTDGKERVESTDSVVKGFMETIYVAPSNPTGYLALMRKGAYGSTPNSRRLANHGDKTKRYFKTVQETCQPGRCVSSEDRQRLGKKKHSTTVLAPDRPAPTVTTLPDDIIHYSEPRILTVRENARLQSFPDWFKFLGKYTTGGKQRKGECPRYTQVGNAVPPLLANAIGSMLGAHHRQVCPSANAVHLDTSTMQLDKDVEKIYHLVLSKLRAGRKNHALAATDASKNEEQVDKARTAFA